jgi:hypothetical protein
VFIFDSSGISLPHRRVGVPCPVEHMPMFDASALTHGGHAPAKPPRTVSAEHSPRHRRESSAELPLTAISALVVEPAPGDSRPVAF